MGVNGLIFLFSIFIRNISEAILIKSCSIVNSLRQQGKPRQNFGNNLNYSIIKLEKKSFIEVKLVFLDRISSLIQTSLYLVNLLFFNYLFFLFIYFGRKYRLMERNKIKIIKKKDQSNTMKFAIIKLNNKHSKF